MKVGDQQMQQMNAIKSVQVTVTSFTATLQYASNFFPPATNQ